MQLEEFLPINYNWQDDLKEGQFENIVEKYCLHQESYISRLNAVFGGLMYYTQGNIYPQDVRYFQSLDWNINAPSSSYMCKGGNTPLTYACEYRWPQAISALIECGAEYDKYDDNGYNPFETVLIGHEPFDNRDVQKVRVCIKILLRYGAKPIARRSILEDKCRYYIMCSPYLESVLKETEITHNLFSREPLNLDPVYDSDFTVDGEDSDPYEGQLVV